MSAVARAFPAAQTVATWWRQLAPLQPGALWVANLCLHRVDALVCVERSCRLDPLSARLLGALAVADTIASMELYTGLSRQFLYQALRSLRAEGLVAAEERNRWQLSAPGQSAVQTGGYSRPGTERRTFHFRPCGGGAQFLPVRGSVGVPCATPEGWAFQLADLDNCLRRPTDWKSQHGFPTDVAPTDPTRGDWRHVAVDTPVRLTVALVLVNDAEVRGFVYSSENGTLDVTQPVFVLGMAASDAFPEIAPPSDEALLAAWSEWCLAHGISTDDACACRVEFAENEVRVLAPKSMAGRVDVSREEAWLLIGDGEVRRAACVAVRPQ